MKKCPDFGHLSGTGGGTRTPDRRIWRPLLYRLSYTRLADNTITERSAKFKTEQTLPDCLLTDRTFPCLCHWRTINRSDLFFWSNSMIFPGRMLANSDGITVWQRHQGPGYHLHLVSRGVAVDLTAEEPAALARVAASALEASQTAEEPKDHARRLQIL